MTRVVVLGCDPGLRSSLLEELAQRGADVILAAGRDDALRALGDGRVDGIVAALDAAPATSGLAVLLAARTRQPAARRVLVVTGRGPLAECALAAGVCDRVLTGASSPPRVGAIAEWLADVGDHAPRRATLS